MPDSLTHDREWLEADGLGGFASGTPSGIRTRRYHALLLAARKPPTERFVLVNGAEVWVETPAGNVALSAQRYAPDVIHPNGFTHLVDFTIEPWPKWTFRLEDGQRIEQEIFVVHGRSQVALAWRLVGTPASPVILHVRPLLSGRDYHSLHHENPGFRFDADQQGERITWQPYADVPEIMAFSNGQYHHAPDWYRNFLYSAEQDRGLDCTEDLASPGEFQWDLARSEAILLLSTGLPPHTAETTDSAAAQFALAQQAESRRRRAFPSPLHRAADAYLVARGMGKTIVAGFPWFTDWGRDTFISLRGLCLSTERLDVARDILLAWSGTVSEGMLPNRFPDHGDTPEYNSVDASLWYAITVREFLDRFPPNRRKAGLRARDRTALETAVEQILTGYAQGTRFGIRVDDDGLVAAGVPGQQLTWMDAKVGDWVVTPRIGKPVEIQALWLRALQSSPRFETHWKPLYERGRASFTARFWNAERGYLNDVVDINHQRGTFDATCRPNQIFAAGGLGDSLLSLDQTRAVIDMVEQQLLTPLGLRSLAPTETDYRGQYSGGVWERDGSYHQGTVWPWLMGPFVEAWLHLQGRQASAKAIARERFLAPLHAHLMEAGLGHISEISDAEPPFIPRGCPFQAWSLAELLRVEIDLLS